MTLQMIGDSEAILRVKEKADHYAHTDYVILITGASGTGKEVLAKYIHKCSANKEGAFRAVNVAAYNANLIDSELFGHEKGAFTGAVEQKKGVFEQVGAGTVLLDEIGDLPLEAQLKLLRVLDTGEFWRVGGGKAIPLKSRVLAATNVNLKQKISRGEFREDLYYRLGLTIEVPPLVERVEDIGLLVLHLIEQEAPHVQRAYPDWFDRDCRRILAGIVQAYPCEWPGNVRGLQRVVRAILLECVCYAEAEDLEKRVKCILDQYFLEGVDTEQDLLRRLLSNVVRGCIAAYKNTHISVRSFLNSLLVDAVALGLELALTVDGFRPQSSKELGEVLGIPMLISSNRSCLPSSENDFMVRALKKLGCREEFPDWVNGLIWC